MRNDQSNPGVSQPRYISNVVFHIASVKTHRVELGGESTPSSPRVDSPRVEIASEKTT